MQSAFTHLPPFSIEDGGELGVQCLWVKYMHRIRAQEDADDVAEILSMRTDKDGLAELGGLQNIVAAARHEAAANKRRGGQRICRGELTNAVQQEDSAGERFAVPLTALPEFHSAI